MTLTETLTTVAVLTGVFFLAYSAIRQQGILETVNEIKQIFQDQADKAKELVSGTPYKN